jgi:hypothetical protein
MQEDGCQEEAHGSGGVLIGVVDGPDAERDNGDGSAGADEKCREVKPAYRQAELPRLLRDRASSMGHVSGLICRR